MSSSPKRLGNLPAHLVSHIGASMSLNNKRRLLLSSKLPAFSELRENAEKEKLKKLKKHISGMYAVSRLVGKRRLKKKMRHVEDNYNKYNPYSPYLNVYRYINVMKKVPISTKVQNPLTIENINGLKKNILRKMRPVKIGEKMFVHMAKKKFSTKNGKTVLYIKKPPNYYDEDEPLLKMYIEKMQNNKKVALYRIIPKIDPQLNNHITFVPLKNYYMKNNVRTLGLVNTPTPVNKKKSRRQNSNSRSESYF